MAKRVHRIGGKTYTSDSRAPFVFVVRSPVIAQGLGDGRNRRRRVRRTMVAMDETGAGAVPDLSAALTAYRNRRRP